MSFQEEYNAARASVNEMLDVCFIEAGDQGELLEAMRYSLLAGGKRIRPVLLMKFCEACGGDTNSVLPAACGIEMLHTYSLIHDDLPAMDNDDLRRGKPTCHKVFGETNALLAGDALQAAAFRAVLSSPVDGDALAKAAYTLAVAAGEQGMCGGQYLDLCNEGEQMEDTELLQIHRLKTGALLRAACLMGVQLAGGSPAQEKAAEEYAENLGLAFQIQDDVLDVTSTAEELGKNIGSDEANQKTTFVTLHGLEGCRKLVLSYTEKAKAAVRDVFDSSDFLISMADAMSVRTK